MAEVKTQKILVIGGTGFIGYHLICAAKRKEWKITSVSLNLPSINRRVDGVQYLVFDLTDPLMVEQNLKEEFNLVVNLGGYIDHRLFSYGGSAVIKSHFTAIQNLIKTLPRDSLNRFVQVGSSDEYGNALAPQHENLRESPISPYAHGKVASTHFLQMLCRSEGFPVVILRLFLTYGPGQGPERFIPQVINGCLRDLTFPVSSGKQLRDFCYVEDVVDAIMKSLTSYGIEGQIFNVASGEPISIRTMIEKVRKLVGKGRPNFGIIPLRKGENMSLYADNSKIQHDLDWISKVTLEEGLQRTIDWYEKNN